MAATATATAAAMMTTLQTKFIAVRLTPDRPGAHHPTWVITRGPAARHTTIASRASTRHEQITVTKTE